MSVIKVSDLSKRYRLGLKEKQAETLVGQIGNVIKSPWQNLKRLRELSRFGIEDESVFWALKDVSFEVKEGEVLGIIGKNGAGKSTLLKILSQITEPTSGKIEIHGRVASLLEVGTGFHPELSGRENIYMNGTILGMTRKEIDLKLDEIIDFSGVEKFIDTPVKFYSSGMKVRLGFSVAAHLDPEILIIDEVLAVGDFEFQNKCLGKMEDVSRNDGRTVIFVSHDLDAVLKLCPKALRLEKGSSLGIFNSTIAIENYISLNEVLINRIWYPNQEDSIFEYLKMGNPEDLGFFNHNETSILIKLKKRLERNRLGIAIKNSMAQKLFTSVSDYGIPSIEIVFKIPAGLLVEGTYTLDLAIFDKENVKEYHSEIINFQLIDIVNDLTLKGKSSGFFQVSCEWVY
ncbi:ABC transporter ATP-binding protein [Algoriphagus litoralis]|uniref:ABC transporter ATP-binding protein n=1 Tax=Algoriphagus litoralis TaxID=2202829 RepID=UPI001E521FFA|nr:ABC transporter ATP-binding protein [Algoriphagus litoralis]